MLTMSLKYILPWQKLPQGDQLERIASELGVSLQETYGQRSLNEPELQRRILEALRFQRDSWLWLLALIAALTSLASALAAWVAVWKTS